MPDDVAWRNYSLAGATTDIGIAPSEWYRCPIPRRRLHQLMRRSDRKGLVNFGLWLFATLLLGGLLIVAWGTWWALPAAILYGVFYGSGANSRWHECSHATVFRIRWLNEAFYQISSFMSLKNPYLWRWSHMRHHSDTIIVGRDPEIAFPRPPPVWGMVLNLLNIRTGLIEAKKTFWLALGQLTADQREFLPLAQRRKAFNAARAHVAIVTCVAALSVALESWLPLMLAGMPTFYGAWLHHLMAATQHAGLSEDVADHRMNSRTVRMNPFLRFIYSNMNYHLEHHMYPLVPFYALPELHKEIRSDCPPPYPSLLSAYKEIVPALLRQRKDPGYCIKRPLPNAS